MADMEKSIGGRLVVLPHPRILRRLRGVCKGERVPRSIVDASIAQPQGYRLAITPEDITLIGYDPAGLFYGRQTLHQLERQFPGGLPCLEIEDWPDFLVRGVLLDISRDKVPTMETLFSLVDLLAGWKINQLQLYMEHTFAYRGHEEVWKDASPMTGEEIRTLDEYCRARFVELVPNQNGFGHMERWLRHPKYRELAEAAEGADTPWGYRWDGPFSLCPTDARSLEFLGGLYDQLLPNFSSRLFNVGCDETFDIGQGRSAERAREIGKTRVYIEFLHHVNKLVRDRGQTMMFWGDIIVEHPELIGELPRDAVALEWGYEADHPFEKHGRHFARAGVPYYVCPGTSSWLSIAGRTDNMLANIRAAAESGLANGAVGLLNTDWGDHGHLQYLPVSYAGFAVGAGVSWCLETNSDLDLPTILNVHAFGDSAGTLGQVACELGNVYQAVGKLWNNSSTLFRILVPSSTHKNPVDGVTLEGLLAAEAAVDRACSSRLGSGLIADEFRNAAAMLRQACRIGRFKLNDPAITEAILADEAKKIIAEHRRLWLARNRPGGLEDSVRRLALDDRIPRQHG
jgi:hexosaminidase